MYYLVFLHKKGLSNFLLTQNNQPKFLDTIILNQIRTFPHYADRMIISKINYSNVNCGNRCGCEGMATRPSLEKTVCPILKSHFWKLVLFLKEHLKTHYFYVLTFYMKTETFQPKVPIYSYHVKTIFNPNYFQIFANTMFRNHTN